MFVLAIDFNSLIRQQKSADPPAMDPLDPSLVPDEITRIMKDNDAFLLSQKLIKLSELGYRCALIRLAPNGSLCFY